MFIMLYFVSFCRFENDRTISFIPPDGEFELMSYRLNTHVGSCIYVYMYMHVCMYVCVYTGTLFLSHALFLSPIFNIFIFLLPIPVSPFPFPVFSFIPSNLLECA